MNVNQALADAPELLNQSPYADGWIVEIEPSSPEQLSELKSAGDYAELIAELSK